jgi:PAS domain S-box/PAS domain S-box
MFSDVFNSTNARIAVRDRQGKLILINNAEAKAHKKEDKNQIGKNPHELYSKEVADKLIEEDKVVLDTGRALQLEEELIVDGCLRSYLISRYPLKNGNGETYGVSIVTVDVTENKKLERQLRDSEKFFQDIFENTIFGIGLMNSELKLFRTNKVFSQITGYKKEELSCSSVSKFTYAIDVKTEFSLIRQVLMGEKTGMHLKRELSVKTAP